MSFSFLLCDPGQFRASLTALELGLIKTEEVIAAKMCHKPSLQDLVEI